jgi:phage-related protein
VREWLKNLELEDRKIIGEDIKDVEFSWPLGVPLVRSLGRELWEVRSRLPQGRIARVVFCVEKQKMILLHGFIKRVKKPPNTKSILHSNGRRVRSEKEEHRIIS